MTQSPPRDPVRDPVRSPGECPGCGPGRAGDALHAPKNPVTGGPPPGSRRVVHAVGAPMPDGGEIAQEIADYNTMTGDPSVIAAAMAGDGFDSPATKDETAIAVLQALHEESLKRQALETALIQTGRLTRKELDAAYVRVTEANERALREYASLFYHRQQEPRPGLRHPPAPTGQQGDPRNPPRNLPRTTAPHGTKGAG